VCDLSQTVARIELMDQTTVQILHVHGTYAFYDCCNLTAEIVARAQPSADTSYTVPGVLDAVLQNYSPTVVGYSGWRGDVIMSALERRLRAALKNKIYWFCFRRPHAAELPEWLKDNPNVSLVVPDGPVRAEESAVLQEPTRMKGTAATTDEVSLSASGIRDIGKDI
jgi:hypothetical protein